MLRIVSGRFLMLHVVRRMVLEEAEGKPAGARPSPGAPRPWRRWRRMLYTASGLFFMIHNARSFSDAVYTVRLFLMLYTLRIAGPTVDTLHVPIDYFRRF